MDRVTPHTVGLILFNSADNFNGCSAVVIAGYLLVIYN